MQPADLRSQALHVWASRAGWALTVGSLCKHAGCDGREEDHTDDMAPVILNEALELLDLLLNFVPLILLPLRFSIQMQLVLIHPGKYREAGVILRFSQQSMAQGHAAQIWVFLPVQHCDHLCILVTAVTCAQCQQLISGHPAVCALLKASNKCADSDS